MAWIESHTVLIRHKKLRDLARELRLRPAHLMGHLHALWHAALEQREDGDLSSWSDEFIAEMSDFSGDAPQYVRLLTNHGWLDQDRKIHDWIDYVGMYLTKKYNINDRERLVKIWSLYGRVYGEKGKKQESEATQKQKRASREQIESKQRADREQIENQQRANREPTVPNQPTNQPNPRCVSVIGDVDGDDGGQLGDYGSDVLPMPPMVDGMKPEYALKTEWVFRLRRKSTSHDEESWRNFSELIRQGLTYEIILSQIKDDSRNRSEPIWEFCKRMDLMIKRCIIDNSEKEKKEAERRQEADLKRRRGIA
jgi:hypothetical protein